jgi:hypothetical protein
MRRFFVAVALVLMLSAPSALAVNDPLVPAENCAPDNAQAVGHPALTNNETPATAANPPFSRNNPGESTGAQGQVNSQATAHCPGAQP